MEKEISKAEAPLKYQIFSHSCYDFYSNKESGFGLDKVKILEELAIDIALALNFID